MYPREDKLGYFDLGLSQTKFFYDRADAGAQLASRLRDCGPDTLVLGLTRGGVPVASEIARALDAELDALVVRKLGIRGQEEVAFGAVAADGTRWLNRPLLRSLRISTASIELVASEQLAEARRRDRLLHQTRPACDVSGRTVMLVDDGLATGATMMAAIRSLHGKAARTLVAVPVGTAEACQRLEREVDGLICLHIPEPFYAVGMYYQHFDATTDAEVLQLLDDHRVRRARRADAPEA